MGVTWPVSSKRRYGTEESGKCIELDAPGATCTITLTSAEMEPAD